MTQSFCRGSECIFSGVLFEVEGRKEGSNTTYWLRAREWRTGRITKENVGVCEGEVGSSGKTRC